MVMGFWKRLSESGEYTQEVGYLFLVHRKDSPTVSEPRAHTFLRSGDFVCSRNRCFRQVQEKCFL